MAPRRRGKKGKKGRVLSDVTARSQTPRHKNRPAQRVHIEGQLNNWHNKVNKFKRHGTKPGKRQGTVLRPKIDSAVKTGEQQQCRAKDTAREIDAAADAATASGRNINSAVSKDRVFENKIDGNILMDTASSLSSDKEDASGSDLQVTCGANSALLSLHKLQSGSKGACVLYDDCWITPNEFQLISGRGSAKDWKRSIKHGDKSLKLLQTEGLLCLKNNKKCRCPACGRFGDDRRRVSGEETGADSETVASEVSMSMDSDTESTQTAEEGSIPELDPLPEAAHHGADATDKTGSGEAGQVATCTISIVRTDAMAEGQRPPEVYNKDGPGTRPAEDGPGTQTRSAEDGPGTQTRSAGDGPGTQSAGPEDTTPEGEKTGDLWNGRSMSRPLEDVNKYPSDNDTSVSKCPADSGNLNGASDGQPQWYGDDTIADLSEGEERTDSPSPSHTLITIPIKRGRGRPPKKKRGRKIPHQIFKIAIPPKRTKLNEDNTDTVHTQSGTNATQINTHSSANSTDASHSEDQNESLDRITQSSLPQGDIDICHNATSPKTTQETVKRINTPEEPETEDPTSQSEHPVVTTDQSHGMLSVKGEHPNNNPTSREGVDLLCSSSIGVNRQVGSAPQSIVPKRFTDSSFSVESLIAKPFSKARVDIEKFDGASTKTWTDQNTSFSITHQTATSMQWSNTTGDNVYSLDKPWNHKMPTANEHASQNATVSNGASETDTNTDEANTSTDTGSQGKPKSSKKVSRLLNIIDALKTSKESSLPTTWIPQPTRAPRKSLLPRQCLSSSEAEESDSAHTSNSPLYPSTHESPTPPKNQFVPIRLPEQDKPEPRKPQESVITPSPSTVKKDSPSHHKVDDLKALPKPPLQDQYPLFPSFPAAAPMMNMPPTMYLNMLQTGLPIEWQMHMAMMNRPLGPYELALLASSLNVQNAQAKLPIPDVNGASRIPPNASLSPGLPKASDRLRLPDRQGPLGLSKDLPHGPHVGRMSESFLPDHLRMPSQISGSLDFAASQARELPKTAPGHMPLFPLLPNEGRHSNYNNNNAFLSSWNQERPVPQQSDRKAERKSGSSSALDLSRKSVSGLGGGHSRSARHNSARPGTGQPMDLSYRK